jgi:hypothetical protein
LVLGGAQIGQSVPGNHALAVDDQAVTVGCVNPKNIWPDLIIYQAVLANFGIAGPPDTEGRAAVRLGAPGEAESGRSPALA